MKCPKCNHALPDDSEFCQYCGVRIDELVTHSAEEREKDPVGVVTSHESVNESNEESPSSQLPDFSKMTPDEMLNEILRMQAKNTIEAMNANSQMQPDHEDDDDFGLVPENPIFTLALKSVIGEEEYLDNLYTVNGEKIKYNRRGSISVAGINGMIDIYETYLPSGEPYKTVYINMYGAKRSKRAPAGFSFEAKKVQPSKKSQKKWQIASIVLIVVSVLLLAANIAQFFCYKYNVADIQGKLDAAREVIEDKDASIASYKKEISSQTTTIDDQKAEIRRLQTKSWYIDEIVSQMRYCNTGYATNNFFASDSVIVVNKNEKNRQFTLTAHWSSGGTVYMDYSSYAAWVTFDNDTWRKSTTMTVHPQEKGMTVVTFRNDVDLETFKILIIVV